MARFCTLFSGSKGNCAYLSGGDTELLVDLGRTTKQVVGAMEARGISPENLCALLVTHEHTDHIQGLKVFLKKYPLPLYATAEVMEKLYWDKAVPQGHPVTEVADGQTLDIGSIKVSCFDTPHDSLHSIGYSFLLADGRRASIATDIGYMSDSVRAAVQGSDLLLLESNYDASMLSVSGYPYALKQRIVSNLGHLSNEGCAAELAGFVRAGATRLVLGHLSENTNLPELASLTARRALESVGIREQVDYRLCVAPRNQPMEMVVF